MRRRPSSDEQRMAKSSLEMLTLELNRVAILSQVVRE